MAATRATADLIAAASVTAGTTKGSPTAGTALSVATEYGGDYHWQITNGATGPTVPVTVELQSSSVGTSGPWDVVYTAYGDTVGSGSTFPQTGTYPIPFGAKAVNAIAYGNTGQAVTVNVSAGRVTAL